MGRLVGKLRLTVAKVASVVVLESLGLEDGGSRHDTHTPVCNTENPWCPPHRTQLSDSFPSPLFACPSAPPGVASGGLLLTGHVVCRLHWPKRPTAVFTPHEFILRYGLSPSAVVPTRSISPTEAKTHRLSVLLRCAQRGKLSFSISEMSGPPFLWPDPSKGTDQGLWPKRPQEKARRGKCWLRVTWP